MSRKKKEETGGTAGKAVPSVVMRALLEDRPTVKGVYLGKDIDLRLVGVRSPGFALSWCMDSTVLPLGHVVGIAGPSQSQKTSLALEFSRVGMGYGGYCCLIDNEGAKYSPSLIRSVLNVENDSDRVVLLRSDSLEECQRRMTEVVRVFHDKKLLSELWTLILDSMSGTETEGEMTKIDEEGSAGRAHPVGALSWTRYMRWLTSRINPFPVLVVAINHLKEKPPHPGQMFGGKSTPGGVAQRFHAMTYFWVKRLWMSGDSESRSTWDFPRVEDGKIVPGSEHLPMEVRKIEITCEKNSQGADNRSIRVDFCFYTDLSGKKRAFFDWDGSLANLLSDTQDSLGLIAVDGKNRYGRLKEVLEISRSRNRYTCPQLDLTGVSPQVMGFAVQHAPELLSKLVRFFGINESPEWTGKMPDPPSPSFLDFEPPPGAQESIDL